MYTDSEQTFPKQTPDMGTLIRADDNNGYQSPRSSPHSTSEYIDIHRYVHVSEADIVHGDLTADQGEGRSEEAYIGQIRQRIRQLEEIVFRQNQTIHQSDVLERNYIATLSRLVRTEKENAVLQEDRERNYNECQFYKMQAEEKTIQLDTQMERVNEMIACCVEDKRKIRDLERQLLLVKEKDEDKTPKRMSSYGPEAKPVSRKQQNPYSGESDICVELQQADENMMPKRKRRHFRTSLTLLPRCRNCSTVFDQVEPHTIKCTFHRLCPLPLKAWKSQLNILEWNLNSVNLNAYRFWPCCGKYGLKEPPGCLSIRKHELVFPDEE